MKSNHPMKHFAIVLMAQSLGFPVIILINRLQVSSGVELGFAIADAALGAWIALGIVSMVHLTKQAKALTTP